MLLLFDASVWLLIAEELVPLLCTNFISVKPSRKLVENYCDPLVRYIENCWCYLKGDIATIFITVCFAIHSH